MKDLSNKQYLASLFKPSLKGFIPLVTIHSDNILRFVPALVFKSNTYTSIKFKYNTSSNMFKETYLPLPLRVNGIGSALTGGVPAVLECSDMGKTSASYTADILNTSGFLGKKVTIYFVQVEYLNDEAVLDTDTGTGSYKNYVSRTSRYVIDKLSSHSFSNMVFNLNPILFPSNAQPLNELMTDSCRFTYRRANNNAWDYTDANGDAVACPYNGAKKYDINNEQLSTPDTDVTGDVPSRNFGCCVARFGRNIGVPNVTKSFGFGSTSIKRIAVLKVGNITKMYVLSISTPPRIYVYNLATKARITTDPLDNFEVSGAIDIAVGRTMNGSNHNHYLSTVTIRELFVLKANTIVAYNISDGSLDQTINLRSGSGTSLGITVTHYGLYHYGKNTIYPTIQVLTNSLSGKKIYNYEPPTHIRFESATRGPLYYSAVGVLPSYLRQNFIVTVPTDVLAIDSRNPDILYFLSVGKVEARLWAYTNNNTIDHNNTFDFEISGSLNAITYYDNTVYISTNTDLYVYEVNQVNSVTYPYGGFLGLDKKFV